MKKIIVILIIGIFGYIIFNQDNISDNIRIRVIANTNTEIDIYEKNKVVEIVKSVIKADDTEKDIEIKLDVLRKKINSYSKEINKNIKVEFKNTNFPAKSLNGEIIPRGVYKTLLITIGKGEGNNYWSLLYPEYYGITFEEIDSKNIIVESYFKKVFKKIFK